jgi:hypothetical protein
MNSTYQTNFDMDALRWRKRKEQNNQFEEPKIVITETFIMKEKNLKPYYKTYTQEVD